MLPKVLVVDDDADLREAIREELQEEGYTVRTAGDGRAALEELRAHQDIDLVLVDLTMPTMGGRELIQALHREGNTTPVVVVSGVASPAAPGGGRLRRVTGAAGVLGKPFSLEALLEIVARHTSRG